MIVNSTQAQEQAVLNLAMAICVAVRTAPKACGIDHLESAILTDDEKRKLSQEMRRLGQSLPAPFFFI